MEKLLKLADLFEKSKHSLLAMGNETRLHIVMTMLKLDCHGVRVGEITAHTHLSRPAVSHHLGILKEAGIIGLRREGTKNYYFLDSDLTSLSQLEELIQLVKQVILEENREQ